ncbi:MAG: hypothetical protein MRY63_04005 [Neomegalonema sp.]|nr:hypothetical protein [Neomegalonema sp.]
MRSIDRFFVALLALAAALPLGGSADAAPVRISIMDPQPALQREDHWSGLRDRAPVLLDYAYALRNGRSIDIHERSASPTGPVTTLSTCAFGELPSIARVYPSGGSNHRLITVILGEIERHAANLAYCGYSGDAAAPIFMLRGCFLAQNLPIPTAEHWILSPLPASACGLGGR